MDTRKYDENNGGLQFIFDRCYKTIEDKGISSNLIACPGRDIERYIRYASMVCTAPNTKAYFFEYKGARLPEMHTKVENSQHQMKHNIRLVHGNVITYESVDDSPGTSRVEDLGLGIGIREMVYSAIPRLYRQANKISKSSNGGTDYKVQIITGALRWVSPSECYDLFQQYLWVLKLKMRAFNGMDAIENPTLFTSSKHANAVHSYTDKYGRNCKVYNHSIELFPSERYTDVSVHMHTYMNGCKMLQAMIMYK